MVLNVGEMALMELDFLDFLHDVLVNSFVYYG